MGENMPRAYFWLVLFVVLAPILAHAELGSGVFLEIQDGITHNCIDVTKYNVSMMLVTIQVNRTNTFWKKSKTLGAKFDVILLSQEGKPFIFPRGTQLSARDIIGDIALLPIKSSIMAKYSLVDDKPYVNVSLNLYVINIEKQSQAAGGIFQFIEFSKSLPLPPSPYIQGVQLFGEFAQKVVNENILSAEEKEPVAIFSFDLPSSDEDVQNCPLTGLREGINAVMFSYSGDPQDGVLPLEDYSKYCYFFESASARILYRPKKNNACDMNGEPTILRNPLVAFLVARWSKSPASARPVVMLPGLNPLELSQRQPTLTDTAVDLAVNRLAKTYEEDIKLKSANVKKIFEAINSREAKTASLQSVIENLHSANPATRVLETEAAVSLHLCSIAGIPAVECQ
jgi:hypothetical protein